MERKEKKKILVSALNDQTLSLGCLTTFAMIIDSDRILDVAKIKSLSYEPELVDAHLKTLTARGYLGEDFTFSQTKRDQLIN